MGRSWIGTGLELRASFIHEVSLASNVLAGWQDADRGSTLRLPRSGDDTDFGYSGLVVPYPSHVYAFATGTQVIIPWPVPPSLVYTIQIFGVLTKNCTHSKYLTENFGARSRATTVARYRSGLATASCENYLLAVIPQNWR